MQGVRVQKVIVLHPVSFLQKSMMPVLVVGKALSSYQSHSLRLHKDTQMI